MNTDPSTHVAVERAFNSYIKSCLTCSSKRFFSKLHQVHYHTITFDESNFDINMTIHVTARSIEKIDELDQLNTALNTLSNTEKRLISLKFFQGKTDQEIAASLRISRQAVTKSKHHILEKLKRSMD